MIYRSIPSTQEQLPVIGLGTWQTFDVSATQTLEPLMQVLSVLYNAGGRLIDSSPMYGKAEESIGRITEKLSTKNDFFYATKVWIQGKKEGVEQMENSLKKMGRQSIDLMQIHNLVDWQTHLQTLKKWKAEGRIKYIGITHYKDAAHDELVKIIEAEKIDFVQFNYSLFNRHAEKRLLPAAINNGVATLINRPFGEGKIFANVQGKSLPSWATAIGISSWSQFFLKFIISHPAVNCVIPATGNPLHAADNMKAAEGILPDAELRSRMASFAATL